MGPKTLAKDYETMSLRDLAAANHTSRYHVKAALKAAGIPIRKSGVTITKLTGPFKPTLPQGYRYIRDAIRAITIDEPSQSIYNRIYARAGILGLKKFGARNEYYIIADDDIPKLVAELTEPQSRKNSVIGRRFKQLTVLSVNAGKAEVRCDCGTIKIVNTSNLYDNRLKSCGCLQRKMYANSPCKGRRKYLGGQSPAEVRKAWNAGYTAHIDAENKRFVEWAADLGMTAQEAADASNVNFHHVVDITSGRQACGVKLAKSVGQNRSFEVDLRKLAKSLAKTPMKIHAARKIKYRSWS